MMRPLEEQAAAFKIQWPFDFSFPVERPSVWFCNLFSSLNSFCLFYFNLLCRYWYEQTYSVQSDPTKLRMCSLGSRYVEAGKQPGLGRLMSWRSLMDSLFGQWIWKIIGALAVLLVRVCGSPPSSLWDYSCQSGCRCLTSVLFTRLPGAMRQLVGLFIS